MPREAPLAARGWIAFPASLPDAWRKALGALVLALLGNVALFGADWTAMAGQWWNSSTYNHVLLVPAIIGWLVWQRKAELAAFAPKPWWPALGLAAVAVLAWVLGAFAGLTTGRQLGAVLLLIASVLLLLGPRVSAALAFPIGYLLLLVPFGDELIPALQIVTARITVALVHLSGVPGVIDGVFIDTPAGLFEVAEACSGVKFLIAMIAFGLLVANVCLRSPLRRALLLPTCIVVPILANGVRAWGTIFAAQYVGAETAAGIDHIIYGWVFFAIVMALVLGLWWRFFDRDVDEPPVDVAALQSSALLDRLEGQAIARLPALAGLLAIALAGTAWAAAADRLRAELPARIELPQVGGWHRVEYRPAQAWQPRASGAEHRLLGSYADSQGRTVDVFYALYASQDEGGEAGGFGEGVLMPDTPWSWQSDGPPLAAARSDRLLADNGTVRLALTFYRTGGLLTGSNARLKLANITDRLLLRERATALLIVSAEERPGRPARDALAAFLASAGPLDAWMDRVGRIR